MAHETLKATIRQYIGPNGQNSITGQIMQDILIAMVDEYPNLSGYATQSWVQQQGYITSSALDDYLPLSGGTLTGDLYLTNGKKINIILIEGRRIVDLNLGYSQISGTEYAWNMHIESALDVSAGLDMDGVFVGSGFKKIDGTSAQFLKADGSVDSNTYITASALSGYATQLWVTSQLAGYATTSQLAGYLPLTGGTLTGALNFNSSDYNIGINTASGEPALQLDSANHIFLSAGGGWIELMADNISCWGNLYAESFIKNGGTADQVLCADGSVKTLAQLKAALDAI